MVPESWHIKGIIQLVSQRVLGLATVIGVQIEWRLV